MYSESFRTISSCFALFFSELFIQLTQYSALICYRSNFIYVNLTRMVSNVFFLLALDVLLEFINT